MWRHPSHCTSDYQRPSHQLANGQLGHGFLSFPHNDDPYRLTREESLQNVIARLGQASSPRVLHHEMSKSV